MLKRAIGQNRLNFASIKNPLLQWALISSEENFGKLEKIGTNVYEKRI